MKVRGWGALLAAASAALAVLAPAAPASQWAAAPVALVRFPFPQDDGSLTPYTFELGYPLMTLVYDTLLARNADGVAEPWLAEAVEVGADGRRVTVRLHAGAAWHDGRPVTSDDVAFTFAHVASRPHPRFTAQVGAVQRVEAPDARTAVFVLSRPSPGFVDQPLADVPILPRHLWQGLAPGTLAPEGLPVGSGPYRLVEHRPDVLYRFEANAGYFRGAPAVGVLEVPIIKTAEDTVRAFEQRRVDMVPVSLPASLAERVDTTSVTVVEGPSYLGTVLVLNGRAPPFDRLEVRRAVAQALDLGRIARVVGGAVAAERGYLHPASPFASPEDLHHTDVVAARRVLGQLSAPLSVITADNDPVRVEAGHQVVQSLRGAGAAAELTPLSRQDLGRAVGEDGSPPSFQAAIWVAPPLASYDPGFLGRVFGSDPAQAAFNHAGYRSAAFDEAMGRVTTTPDVAERRAATADALRILAAEVPVVPLFFAPGAFAYRPAVYDGWVFIKGTGILHKRSFLGRGIDDRSSGPAPPPAPAPGARGDDDGGSSVVGLAAVAVLSLAAVLAAFGAATTLRERRSRRR